MQLRCYEPRGALSCGIAHASRGANGEPAEQGHVLGRFVFCAHLGGDMLHRLSVSSSRRGVVFRLILLLIVGAFIADCQDAERSVAPAAGRPQLSLLAAQGLKGTIAFHSSRSGDRSEEHTSELQSPYDL